MNEEYLDEIQPGNTQNSSATHYSVIPLSYY